MKSTISPLTIISFRIDSADKSPVEVLEDVYHGPGLEVVRGNSSCEVLEAAFVTQRRTSRCVAHLRNLK